ncbi:MAG: DUF2891 domain-containing protein [Cellvibrionaceae bacterium]|nr:DUF2891 domain-containing protein [Cellvibrionaceae bacterium]
MFKTLLAATVFSVSSLTFGADKPATISPEQSEAMAALASGCIHQQYPNSIKHYLLGEQDVRSPKQLYPAFYGCLDWHSSVHGHWLLLRLLHKTEIQGRDAIIRQLQQSFSADNINGELAYFNRPKSGTSFERPYGLAWLLQLTTELRQWSAPEAVQWLQTLQPLEDKIVANISAWLPKLAYPIRTGEHSQTAFAFGLMWDWADVKGDKVFQTLLRERINQYYRSDRNCPIAYEPSGQDFLSPCLAEADLMRRLLPRPEYAKWLAKFLPTIPGNGREDWLPVARVTDRSDGKLAHLDGLNLSRAWMLEGIASALHVKDKRRAAVLAAAKAHRDASVPVVMGDLHYMGSHWLGSFATYLLTERGIQ